MDELTGTHPNGLSDMSYAFERTFRARAEFDGPGSDL